MLTRHLHWLVVGSIVLCQPMNGLYSCISLETGELTQFVVPPANGAVQPGWSWYGRSLYSPSAHTQHPATAQTMPPLWESPPPRWPESTGVGQPGLSEVPVDQPLYYFPL